ncbi:DUF4105 domain-containing protein [Tenacibaculum sp. 190524A02b]|uniref:DUF4105 domain-containing protein n=1 Tax=Tenacibaculum vairaonense TaxID=3137860 RepID=A0ABP1FD60_9FLAO
MIIKKYLTLLFFFSFFGFSIAQQIQLSKFSQVSIITYGPGDALYEKFGHTAIRIKDPMFQFDLVYNYGIFDLDEANFYVNFTKGFMRYKLARYSFPRSLKLYGQDERWVKEQVLNLTRAQKNAVFKYLEDNAQPEKASYFYDPFFNNCSTKPRDVIKEALGKAIIYNDDFVKEDASFRQLMNKEIHTNTWGSLGINIALGSKLDNIASAYEYLYLPDYVFNALEVAKVIKDGKEENLVLQTNTLLDFKEKELHGDTVNPFLIFLLLLFLGTFITYKDYKNNTRSTWFDFSLFLITGLFGILIVFLWFFTNHSTAPNNFNFLWAFAPNFIVAFFIRKKNPPKWISKYVSGLLILLCCIPIVWITKFQLFPIPFASFFVLLAIRYFYTLKSIKNFE